MIFGNTQIGTRKATNCRKGLKRSKADTPYSSSRFPHTPLATPKHLPSPFRFTQKRGTTLGTCAKKRTFVGSSSCSWQLCHCDSSADPQWIRCTDSSRFKRCHRVKSHYPNCQKNYPNCQKNYPNCQKNKRICFSYATDLRPATDPATP